MLRKITLYNIRQIIGPTTPNPPLVRSCRANNSTLTVETLVLGQWGRLGSKLYIISYINIVSYSSDRKGGLAPVNQSIKPLINNKNTYVYKQSIYQFTGAKAILGPICMIPYINIIMPFGPKTGLAPVNRSCNQ